MTIRIANKKDLRPEDLAVAAGGINVDYVLCPKCLKTIGLKEAAAYSGYCEECAGSRPGGYGATGGW